MTQKRYKSELIERITTWKGQHGAFLLRILADAEVADSIGDPSLGESLRMLLSNRTSPGAQLDGPAAIYQKFDGEM